MFTVRLEIKLFQGKASVSCMCIRFKMLCQLKDIVFGRRSPPQPRLRKTQSRNDDGNNDDEMMKSSHTVINPSAAAARALTEFIIPMVLLRGRKVKTLCVCGKILTLVAARIMATKAWVLVERTWPSMCLWYFSSKVLKGMLKMLAARVGGKLQG